MGYYSFGDDNLEISPLAEKVSIQFGRVLDQLLREIMVVDPSLG